MEYFKIVKGITMVVSFLFPREKPEEIKNMCEELGLKHINIADDGPTLKDTARAAFE